MTIDIFGLEETKISRDLREKIITIYGNPKTGKTTIATQFPKSILLAAEKGYNALAGIKAQPIHKWADFKKVLKQLEKPEAHDYFETIILDTVDLFYDMAEKYICGREGVDLIGDIPYGGGYKMLKQEFNDALRSIPMLNFGLVMISHSQTKTVSDSEGTEYSRTMPTLADRPRLIVLGMSDIIGYAEGFLKDGEQKTVLHLRETARFEAGSRFKYTPNVIRFDYDSLVAAIADAIEKEAEEKGAKSVTDVAQNVYEAPKEVPFEDVKKEIDVTITELMKDKTEEEQNIIAPKIKKTIEAHLGKGKMLKDTTEDQRDHIELVLGDLKELLS
ncbi:ATP-binding protein [Bacillus sp. FJAT-22090]|uniref:ATP-binding protein n=1 Tax=Bacillus sp. FJAT-22090 TaxID=1581038 RepID=UPI0011A37176|nr:ATP-binding protein [Bacillus sp. FJAT-22090]